MGHHHPITIRQQQFSSQIAAIDYFMNQRDAVKASGSVTEGEFFEELKELYTRYCSCSPGWELNGRHIVAFVVDYELRENGQYAQHLCYKVQFSNKELRPFSVRKAVIGIVRSSA